MGGRDGLDPLENHKWLFVSLEIVVRTPHEKQLDLSGPVASRWGLYGHLYGPL